MTERVVRLPSLTEVECFVCHRIRRQGVWTDTARLPGVPMSSVCCPHCLPAERARLQAELRREAS